MFRKTLSCSRGSTLPELIIGSLIMILIMSGIVSVLGSSIRAYQSSQKRIYEEQQARTAINSIAQEIKYATSIGTLAKGQTANSITYTVNSTPNTIQFGSGQSSKTLLKNTTPLTANIITNASFYRDSTDGRIIKITLSLNSPENNSSGDFLIEANTFAPNLSI